VSKVTLEDAAQILAADANNCVDPVEKMAALVRSAARVVEAAKAWREAPRGDDREEESALCAALGIHARIEAGDAS